MKKLVSRLMLAVFLLAAGSAATSAQPFPNPIVKFVGSLRARACGTST